MTRWQAAAGELLRMGIAASTRLRDHLRSNVVGYVALFIALTIALGGTAIAGPDATTSEVTKSKAKRIAKKQINKLAPRLSVANADHVGGASLASIAAGNDAFIADCQPSSTAYVQCGGSNGGAALTLAREAKVLVIYGWSWSLDDVTGVGLGRCRTTRNGADTSGDITMGEGLSWPPADPDPVLHQHTGGLFDYAAPPVVDIQGPLQPGSYRFGLRCSEEFGDIRYTGIRIATLVMGTG